MIDDLVDASRLETGRMEVMPKPVDLREIVKEVIPKLVTRADASRVEVEAPANLPLVLADHVKIGRVFDKSDLQRPPVLGIALEGDRQHDRAG